MGEDIELKTEAIQWLGGAMPLYLVYNAALYLAAPVGVIGTIVALLGKLTVLARTRFLARKRPTYVFSCLNKPSLVLAKSILAERKGECLVLFADADESEESLVSDAKAYGFLCLNQSAAYIADKIYSPKAGRFFLFTSAEEKKNLNEGLSLAHKLAKRYDGLDSKQKRTYAVPSVYLSSSSDVGGSVVDARAAVINTGPSDECPAVMRVRLRRIDWVRSTVDALLDKYPLFSTGLEEGALTIPRGFNKLAFDYSANRRRILVVGDGDIAYEFIKGAVWASQMGDVKTRIDVVAGDSEALKDRLSFEAPELFAEEGGDGTRPRLGHYDLHFTTCNPQGPGYLRFLKSPWALEYTYVLVALGDDLASSSVACRTRSILEQTRLTAKGAAPAFIAAVVRSSEMAASLETMHARKAQYYAIAPVGTAAEAFSYSSVFMPALENCAMNLNRVYSRDNINKKGNPDDETFRARVHDADFWYFNKEYDRRSSIASALHRKYSLFLACRLCGKKADDTASWSLPLDRLAIKEPELIDFYSAYAMSDTAGWLAEVEHYRWNAYVMTEGFEYVDDNTVAYMLDTTGSQRYDLARLHACLTSFEKLPKLDKAFKERGDESRKPFQEIDEDILVSIRVIVCIDDDPSLSKFRSVWERQFPS